MDAARLQPGRLDTDARGDVPPEAPAGPAGGTVEAGDVRGKLLALAGWCAGAFLLTGLGTAVLVALVGNVDWWRGLFAATLVSLLAAVFSCVPIALAMGRGQLPLVVAFFVAMAMRAGMTLFGGLLAVSAGDWPRVPTLLLAMPYYFALVAVESAVVGRELWKTDTKLTKTDA
ncbi:MAG: hypothetical protein ACFCVE_09650 [Phycisphaerae bacterium]